jgi:hypothetical protein
MYRTVRYSLGQLSPAGYSAKLKRPVIGQQATALQKPGSLMLQKEKDGFSFPESSRDSGWEGHVPKRGPGRTRKVNQTFTCSGNFYILWKICAKS